jgi:hypothetical protein
MVELERMERQFALAGEASAEDLDIYARVAGNLRRLLESVRFPANSVANDTTTKKTDSAASGQV